MKARKPTSRLVCASHATSFNGAAPLKARKHAALRWVLGLLARLQWGRAVEGAETSALLALSSGGGRFNGAAPLKARKRGRAERAGAVGTEASMGPRR